MTLTPTPWSWGQDKTLLTLSKWQMDGVVTPGETLPFLHAPHKTKILSL